jgi:hypothetical protein
MRVAYEYLRERASPAGALDHLGALAGIERGVDFADRRALSLQQA